MNDDVCPNCRKPTPALMLALNFGRCKRCFLDFGLASTPPPAAVLADLSKVPCQRCGALILPATAWRTLGRCMPCVREGSKPVKADPQLAKAKFSRQVDPAAEPASRFFSRYSAGEHEVVWQEMRALGGGIGEGAVWNDVEQTVRYTMERVRNNVEVIVDRLRTAEYEFADPEAAHIPPTAQSLDLLQQLEEELGSFPLSLKLFYEVVGSVNLCQSIDQLKQGVFEKEERAKIPPLQLIGEEYPLYVASLEDLNREARRIDQTRDGRRYLWIAPDECARAHYSNGDDCHVLLPEAGVDFRWIELRDEEIPPSQWLWFVDLLREAFRGGGFQGRTDPETGARTPPDNDLAEALAAGLLQI